MAKLLRKRRLHKIIANCEAVQDALSIEAFHGEARAREVLAEHRYSGDARVTVEMVPNAKFDSVDRFVILTDEAGQAAANVIEYGRPEGSRSGAMKAIAPLRKAFGLRVEE